MALPLPNPIVFDLSVRDKKEVRAAYVFAEMGRLGNVVPALVIFSAILQTIGPSVRLYKRHGNDPADWVMLVVELTLVAVMSTFMFLRSRAATMFEPPEIATVVSFGRPVSRSSARIGAAIGRPASFRSLVFARCGF